MPHPGGKIVRIETPIVDVPFRRPHKLSRATILAQAYVIVRIHTEDGMIGTGDAVVPGGPWWGGESAETIKLMIDTHIAPILIGQSVFEAQRLMAHADRVVFGNPVAKSAVEVAMIDAACRSWGISISDHFGGRVTDSIPVLWALGTGEKNADVAEAKALVAADRHHMFKIKLGFGTLDEDIARVIETADAIGVPCSIDLNEAWDIAQASYYLPRLKGSRIVMIEQPIARTNLTGMAALTQQLDIPVMADESVCTPQQALAVVEARAADSVSLKISKSGGLRKTQAIASIAQSAGLACFGGTALDGSIGVAASLQLFATMPELRWGCELFGPLLLSDDVVATPIVYKDNKVWLPEGPGTGIEIDEGKLRHYAREGTNG
jgi:muconate cycloisomerase